MFEFDHEKMKLNFCHPTTYHPTLLRTSTSQGREDWILVPLQYDPHDTPNEKLSLFLMK